MEMRFSKYKLAGKFSKRIDEYNGTIDEWTELIKEYDVLKSNEEEKKLKELTTSDASGNLDDSEKGAAELFSKAYGRDKTHCLVSFQYKNGYGEAFAKFVPIDSLTDGEESGGIKIHLTLMTLQMLFTDKDESSLDFLKGKLCFAASKQESRDVFIKINDCGFDGYKLCPLSFKKTVVVD